ncbi:MAG: RHS repeat domain-containing protein [Bacteroidales bacterium]
MVTNRHTLLQKDFHYLYHDHLGSLIAATKRGSTVLEEFSYDPWGRRRNPYDWNDYEVTEPTLFTRGFTGHEHIGAYGLINMNGRVYDPRLGRFLSPDPYVQSPDFTQSFNRYSYCFNNPLVYVDPDGEIAWFVPIIIGAAIFGTGNLVAHAVRGDVNSFGDGLKYFAQGALAGAVLGAVWQFAPLIPGIGQGIQTGMTIYGKAQLGAAGFGVLGGVFQSGDDWSPLNNSLKMFLGNFYLDENHFWGGVWKGISRHTWEFKQSLLGHTFSQGLNAIGRIDAVGYFGGSTISRGDIPFTRGVSLGAFILGNDIAFDPFETFPGTNILTPGARLLRHEYGHYIQSQVSGPLYLFKYGIPSALTQGWIEIDAEFRSDQYFRRNFGSAPAFNSYPANYRPVNPKWWEFGLFFGSITGAGIWGYGGSSLIISLLNINKAR